MLTLFPIMQLSAYESENWVPFSPVVITSLFKQPLTWLTFLPLSALALTLIAGTVGFPVGFALLGDRIPPQPFVDRNMTFVLIPVVLCAGVMGAAGVIVYARLMGRLGHLIVLRARKDAARKEQDREEAATE